MYDVGYGILRGELMGHTKNLSTAILIQSIIAVAIVLLWSPAARSGPEDDSDFSVSVPGVRLLTLERDSIRFEADILQIVDGWTNEEMLVARVSANVDWVLTVRGSEELWEGPWQKPVSDIYWSYGGGEYRPLSSTESAQVVAGGLSKEAGYPIELKVKLDLEKDVPGEYYYSYLVVELTAP
jgi:hypothetical protein